MKALQKVRENTEVALGQV